MRKTKKTLAILALVAMVLTMIPLQVFAATDNTRLGGADRVATAIAIADAGFTSADTVIVAPADDANVVDALAAAPLAGKTSPILLAYKDGSSNASVQAEITKLGAKNVYLIGAAANDKVTFTGVTVTKLAGADRIATAAAINAKLSSPAGTFVVGYNGTPDALSVASYAAANNYAIVLTNVDGTVDASKLVGSKTYLVGGTGVVKDYAGATRFGGADRYLTNQAVIKGLTFTYNKVYVANGESLVDALAAAPLAAQANAPIALTDNSTVAAAADINANMTKDSVTIALGGTGVVSDTVKALVAYQVPATLSVVSVSAVDGKDLKVTFNKAAAKDSLTNPSNYTFSVTTGSSLAIDTNSDNYIASDDRTSVLIPLTGGNFYNGQSFKLSVKNVIDDNFQAMTEYKDTWHLFNDSAAPVLQKAAKKGSNLRLYFDEPVRSTMTVKVDGVVEVTSVTPSTDAGDNYANAAVSADALKTGNHTVVVYNAADWVGASGNSAPIQTLNYTITDDTTAPSVVSVTPDGGTTFKVKFSETLSTLTTSNFVVKKGNATLTTSDAEQDSDDSTVWNVTVAGTGDVDLYDSGESTTTLSVAVKGYYDSSNLYGAEYDATITLSKDTTGPVIVSSAYNSATSGAITLKFNETLNDSFSYDASKITVVKDSILKSVSSASVSGKNLILVISGLTDGTYSVTLAKGTVKDLSGNSNDALSTSVTYSATSGSAYYGIGSITVTQSGSANVIEIPYQTEMTNSAVDTTNYQLDGMPLPTGTSAYFTDSDKDTVDLRLPSGTIDSSVQRLLTFSKNITTDDGRVIETSGKNELTATITGFADNVKPVLSSAQFVISSLSDTTTSSIRLKFSENMGSTLDTDDFKVSVNGIKVTVSSITDTTSGDKYLTLVLSSPINMSQTVTVEVVKAADQADTTMGTKDTSSNTLTESTSVTVSDKTTSL